jgi:hypothetical protein
MGHGDSIEPRGGLGIGNGCTHVHPVIFAKSKIEVSICN